MTQEEEFRNFIKSKARGFWDNPDGTVSRQSRVFVTEKELFDFGCIIADAAVQVFANQPQETKEDPVALFRIFVNKLIDMVANESQRVRTEDSTVRTSDSGSESSSS